MKEITMSIDDIDNIRNLLGYNILRTQNLAAKPYVELRQMQLITNPVLRVEDCMTLAKEFENLACQIKDKADAYQIQKRNEIFELMKKTCLKQMITLHKTPEGLVGFYVDKYQTVENVIFKIMHALLCQKQLETVMEHLHNNRDVDDPNRVFVVYASKDDRNFVEIPALSTPT